MTSRHRACRCCIPPSDRGIVATGGRELGAIGIAIRFIGEFADEVVQESCIGNRVGRCAGHEDHQVGILQVVGQLGLNGCHTERGIIQTQAVDLEGVGKTGTDGVAQRIGGRGCGLEDANHLTVLIEQRTAHSLFGSAHGDGVVSIIILELLRLTDQTAGQVLRLTIGQEPERGAHRRCRLSHGEGL